MECYSITDAHFLFTVSKRLQTGANKVFLSKSSVTLTSVISMNSKVKMFHRKCALKFDKTLINSGVTFFVFSI